MLPHLRRLVAHMTWADSRVLERLRHGADEGSVGLLAHILGAEKIWLTRLRGGDSSALAVWPMLDLDGCAVLAAEAHDGFVRYLDALDEALLPEAIVYRNQKGVEFHTLRSDILTHVFMHGNYHRGQIARALREAGREPVATDYIVWAREQAR